MNTDRLHQTRPLKLNDGWTKITVIREGFAWQPIEIHLSHRGLSTEMVVPWMPHEDMQNACQERISQAVELAEEFCLLRESYNE